MVEANAAYKHGDINESQLAKTYFIYAIANQILYVGAGALVAAIMTGKDVDEDFWKKAVSQSIISLFGGLPIIRDMAESFSREMLGLRVYDDALPVLEELGTLFISTAKLAKGDEDTDKNIRDVVLNVLEIGGISANNALKLWNATILRNQMLAERKLKKTNSQLSEKAELKSKIEMSLDGMSKFYSKARKNQLDYREAEAAHKLKYAYSTAKSKATQLEKEGNKTKADRIRKYVKDSKVNLSYTDYSYYDIQAEMRQFEKYMEVIMK